jgi:transposase InsO family protein
MIRYQSCTRKQISQASPSSSSTSLCKTGYNIKYGFQRAIRVDQGTEFVSRDLDLWAYQRGVTLDFSLPDKPTDNAFIESFNSKFRAECLNAHWFISFDDARRKCEARRRDYNEERPHSAIGNKAPIELIDLSAAIRPALAGAGWKTPAAWSKDGGAVRKEAVSR